MRRITTRRTLTALPALALAVTLSACGSDDTDTVSDTTSTASATTGGNESSTEDQNAEVFELYNEALDNLDTDRFTSDDVTLYDGTGEFQYTVTDINGDDLPELLVSAIGETFSNAKVFSVDAAGVVETDQLFADGAATAGGGRAEFHTSANGDGVFRSLGQSASGETWTSRWTLDGDRMVEGQKWEFRIDQKPADLEEEQVEVEWTPVDDRSLLDGTDSATDGDQDQGDGPNPDRSAPPEDDAGEAPADTGGRSKSDFPNFGANSATSDELARIVYNAFIAEYLATGTTNPTLNVASPVTGESYTMTCSYSTNVTCSGGNGATVMIHPPAPDPATIPDGVMWG